MALSRPSLPSRSEPPARRRSRAIIGASAVASGVALILRRRSARATHAVVQDVPPSTAGQGPAGGSPAAPATVHGAADGERQWTCQCGQEYRVQGVDRHRVYWLAGADASDPVLEADCPTCGTTLPREHEHPESVPG